MLISLHLPKTAGLSFLTSIEDYYRDGIVRDYSDLPINTPVFQRKTQALKMCFLNGIKAPKATRCIHGHFLPFKYMLCRGAKFVTWMRDPIERMGSHYYFWMRSYNHSAAPMLHKRVIEEKWSLERFCLCPELRNIYSQFLWRFPIKRFDFIGITEYFETEMDFFASEFIGSRLQVHRVNANEGKENFSYFEDSILRKRIEQYHSKDVSLYKQALDMRLTRLPSGS